MVGLWLVAGGGGEEWLGRDGLAAEPARGVGKLRSNWVRGQGFGSRLGSGELLRVGLGFVTDAQRSRPSSARRDEPAADSRIKKRRSRRRQSRRALNS